MAEPSDAEQVDKASALEDLAQLETFKRWFGADKSHSAEWRKEAKEAFDFVAGHGQWTKDEATALESTGRVPITFNRSLTIIKAVAGIEIGSRHDTVFLPRGDAPITVKKNELLSGASQYMSDECNAEKMQSRAFQDAVKCGMGWVEQGMEYETEPDGKYIEPRVNPLEMYWDCMSREDNLTDARRLWHVRANVPVSEAKARFPGVDVSDLDAQWVGVADNAETAKPVEERYKRDENSQGDEDRATVTLVRLQWWEREPYVRIADPADPSKIRDLTLDQFQMLKGPLDAKGVPYKAVQQMRRVYKQAWIGNTVLRIEEAPCGDRFSWKCITGEPDENKGTWFGLVRVIRDPQKWANKWLTQVLHILNATAKGGILAEEGAFRDIDEAQKTYAQPDAITEVAAGGIAKITPKPGAGLAQNYMPLMEFAVTSIRDTTGINMELLGLRDANQPGVLEQQRKQAGMTILGTLFDSLRQFRREVGYSRLFFIQKYLSDGRWIRIVGEDGQQFVQLIKDKVAGRYDVIVEDAPSSPNQREQTWQLLQPIIPLFRDEIAQNPEMVMLILEQSPLPTSFTERLKAIMQKPNPQAEQNKAIADQSAQAKIAKDRASADQSSAAAERDRIGSLVDVLGAGIDIMTARTAAAQLAVTPSAGGPGPAAPSPQPASPAPPPALSPDVASQVIEAARRPRLPIGVVR